MHTTLFRSTLIGLTLLAAACGSGETPGTTDVGASAGGAAGGTCPEGTADCIDADLGGEGGTDADLGGEGGTDANLGGEADPAADEFAVEPAREQARALLGTPEDELPDDVRVGRRGDEQMALIEDYRLGRMTVELDDDGSGFRVSAVTVELPDGPETFHLD